MHSGDRTLDMWLKRDCQKRWMEREDATEDDFRLVFYASYLDEDEQPKRRLSPGDFGEVPF